MVQGPGGLLAVHHILGEEPKAAVVLIHGFAQNHASFECRDRSFLAYLASHGLDVFAPDLRGVGQSNGAPLARSFRDYVDEDLPAVVRYVHETGGRGPLFLVGHSLGGAVIAAFAERYPEEAAGLFFADSIGALNRLPRGPLESWLEGFGEETYDAFWPPWLSEMRAPARPEVQERVRSRFAATPRPVVEAAIVAASHFDPVAALQAYEGPRMAVVTPQNTLPHSLQNVIPGMPSEVMEGTSHWLMMDRPEAFDALLDAFLEKVR